MANLLLQMAAFQAPIIGGIWAPLDMNQAVAAYFRRDDPNERATKMVLRALGSLWFLVCLAVLAIIVFIDVNMPTINDSLNR